MMESPIPDPEAAVRGYTDHQLREFEQSFGENSREWIIAQNEWARRRSPPWVKVLRDLIALAVVIALAVKFFG
jgi:hypothetical protein